MSRLYVGNVNTGTLERELEDEFRSYGVLRSVWVARQPPGYAFVEFVDKRDAIDAIQGLNGKNGWRVELSRKPGDSSSNSSYESRSVNDTKCYECGEPGHFARECRLRIGPGGLGSGIRSRNRSPPKHRRTSSSYDRRYSPPGNRHGRSRTPPSLRYRNYSPPPRNRNYSPPPRNYSPPSRNRNYSPPPRNRSPPSRNRNYSPPPRNRSPVGYPRPAMGRSSPLHYGRQRSAYANRNPSSSPSRRHRYRSP